MKIFDKIIEQIISRRVRDVRKRYNRILPLGDYFLDRWTKAKFADFGENSSVYDSCVILGKVSVGKNCWIGPFTILDGSGGELVIGDNCNISAGVHIYTHDTVERVIYDKEIAVGPVNIGKNCYIGPNSIITKNVTLGEKVIIGSNSFVNKDIPSNSKAFGTPVKIVGEIEL